MITEADLAKLAGVTRLGVDLMVGGSVSQLPDLHCLTSIDGSLRVLNSTALTQISLPGLAEIKGGIEVNNASVLASL